MISPIGEPETSVRERADIVLHYIIEPALKPFGYKAVRADDIDRPGVITTQVIQHVLNDPLVIADLTDRNPNVFYELAIRHFIREPFIQIIQEGEPIPFDIAGTRTVFVDHNNLPKASEATENIRSQIESLETNPDDLDTPITTSIDLQRIRQSETPQDRLLLESFQALMRVEIGNLSEVISGQGNSTRQDLQETLERTLQMYGFPLNRRTSHNAQVTRYIASQVSPGQRFLILLSAFREDAPWAYELGIEAFRRWQSNGPANGEMVFEELNRLLDANQRFLSAELTELRAELGRAFHELGIA